MQTLNFANPRDARNGWLLWSVLCVVVAAYMLAGSRRSVTVHYENGANRWLAAAPLYEGTGEGFIYLPQAAILYIPFSMLPHVAGELAWRVCTIGLFIAGVVALARRARLTYGEEFFAIMTTVAVPLAFSSARNGQSTLAIAGLTMLAACDLADRRWGRATLYLTLGVAVKPLMIVPLLLAAAMYWPMIWRLAAGMAVMAGLPFLLASPQYVMAQYAACVEMLSTASQLGVERYWAQLFGVFKVAGVEVPGEIQTLVRALAAGLTLAACLWRRWKLSPARTAIFLYTLAGCYLMLFNPRSENNGYSFIGPAIGLFCAHAWLVKKDKLSGAFLIVVAIGVVGSFEIGRLFTHKLQAVWLAPVMCTFFTAYVVTQLLRGEESRPGELALAPPVGSTARAQSWRRSA